MFEGATTIVSWSELSGLAAIGEGGVDAMSVDTCAGIGVTKEGVTVACALLF